MSDRHATRRPVLAWVIALTQIAALAQSVVVLGVAGVWSAAEIAVPGVMAFAAVGAWIVSRRPRNRLGWMLLFAPVPVTLNVLIVEYADLSTRYGLGLPFVEFASWVVNWAWTPLIGSFPAILVRFPEGRVSRGWRFVDWFAIAGTVVLALGLALTAEMAPGYNAFTAAPMLSLGKEALAVGTVLLATATVCAAGSLLQRYQRGDRKLRSQLKWILLAAIAVMLTSIYMAIVELVYQASFADAMLPSTVVLVLIPIAIGVAIMHNRLFDIDVIVNRTLVYILLTAVLGGMYIGVIELVQRLFVLYTGETSDTAIVITAFIVAAAFTPVQKWVDRLVELRFGGRDAAARVDQVSSSMRAVVRVIDPNRVARWLVDELVTAFEAEGGVLYLEAHDHARPFCSAGHLKGEAAVEVVVRHGDRDLGRLLLGGRRGGAGYSRREIEALNEAAGALGEAIAVAGELGHIMVAGAKPVRAIGA